MRLIKEGSEDSCCKVSNFWQSEDMQTKYTILKDSTGARAVKFGSQIIPADIAGLCGGKDKWLSEIKCKCRDCKQEFPLSELHGGGQWCEPCQEASIEE